MPSGKPRAPDRPVLLSAQKCAGWGVIAPGLTRADVEWLTEGVPILGLRHGTDPVFDPVAARQAARDRAAGTYTLPEHAGRTSAG